MLRSTGSILALKAGISRQALGPETLMVFLELGIGMAVRYRLPCPNGVLRLSVCFIRDLLLGGALPFGHCQILTPTVVQGYPDIGATQIISGAYDRRLSHMRRLETSMRLNQRLQRPDALRRSVLHARPALDEF
jgi:hypothetical protein